MGEAPHTASKVHFALENFIVSPEAFASMFEGCFSHLRSSFCGEVSDLFVNRIWESLSTLDLCLLSFLARLRSRKK